MLLSLPDVTLCAVTSINHELTVRAMNECLRHCSFADAVMISSQPVKAPFRVEVIPAFTGAEYAPFICKNLTKYTSSAFNLLVQYDGYIVEPLAWTDAFLAYDYIGPKWPWHRENRRVGNSGFCLRSKKLLDILSKIPLPPAGEFVDDELICHTMRDQLESIYNIKIAPEDIADRFAYERHVPDQPTFGFHGMFNFCRHVDDAEMEKIPDLLADQYVPSRFYVEVLLNSFSTRKFPVFYSWYRRLREHMSLPGMHAHLLEYMKNPVLVDELVAIGEKTGIRYEGNVQSEVRPLSQGIAS